MSLRTASAPTAPHEIGPSGSARRAEPGLVRGRRLGDVLVSSDAVLGHASVSLQVAERQIEDLWRDSVGCGDVTVSDRLTEVGRVLHRAAQVLDGELLIGSGVSAEHGATARRGPERDS
jgi:hypothetical protein